MESARTLVGRLVDSIGEAVFEGPSVLAQPPAPRTTWIDLQHEVVARGTTLPEQERAVVARALLQAVLKQPSFGPSNRLDEPTFAFLLESLGDELATALEPWTGHLYGGQRYLRQRVWTMPGPVGARWFARLAAVDDVQANALYQDMCSGKLPRWADEDWPARLDAIAALPARPLPTITSVLFLGDPPRVAGPALVRVALAHAVDERDGIVRTVAGFLRGFSRGEPAEDLDLVDWGDHRRRADLFRWVLELMGDEGHRGRLVRAAAAAGLVTPAEAAVLAAPLERPAWADGDVPWVVRQTHVVGTVALPSQRLTGGDPWFTEAGHLPWEIAIDRSRLDVEVVVAEHPLVGPQCAALVARVGDEPVAAWRLVEGAIEPEGYTVEVGIAGLGSIECYESGAVFDLAEDVVGQAPPMWRLVDGGDVGTIALCSVGPQHQMCRTWCGRSASGEVVAVVTDLGLLDLDLEADPQLPW